MGTEPSENAGEDVGEVAIAPGTRFFELWRGIEKLPEEMGELLQLVGKIKVRPIGVHWDEVASGPMYERLEHELGDVLAAVEYFVRHSPKELDWEKVDLRRRRKLETFEGWKLSGVLVAVPADARCQMEIRHCGSKSCGSTLPCPEHGWRGATP